MSQVMAAVLPRSAGSTVRIKGELISRADFYFDGDLEGSIEAVHSVVTLGPNAKVIGDISARRVVVSGSVTGNIVAVEQVALARSARLQGNLSTARIAIEDGAYFSGQVDMRRGGGERKATTESTALVTRYSKLMEAKYGRGLTAAEEADLESVYAGLIAHDSAYYEPSLAKVA